jgi:hypothetical protein
MENIMKLAYRGISYEPQTSIVEATATEQAGLFLGQSFQLKHFSIAQRHSGTTHLRYRGVDYTQA